MSTIFVRCQCANSISDHWVSSTIWMLTLPYLFVISQTQWATCPTYQCGVWQGYVYICGIPLLNACLINDAGTGRNGTHVSRQPASSTGYQVPRSLDWKIHVGSKKPNKYCYPDSKVHGTKMGPTWVLSAPDGPHVGPMKFAFRECLRKS